MTSGEEPVLVVIDLGTNTFHLLVARRSYPSSIEIVEKKSFYVHLAENGRDIIGQSAIQRAMHACIEFNKVIAHYRVEWMRVIGTAAMRNALNGKELSAMIWSILGVKPEVISGKEEARLISLGVLQALPTLSEPILIMDIGGGSVEFILVKEKELVYMDSFPIGVAYIRQHFDYQHPISVELRSQIISYIKGSTKSLMEALSTYRPTILVGASGTFDVLSSYIPLQNHGDHCVEIDCAKLIDCFDEVYQADWEQLEYIHWLPEERRKLIAAAFCLIEFVLEVGKFKRIFTSSYAIKEGVILDYLAKNG